MRLSRSAARALARVAIVALTVGASGCAAIGDLAEPAAARELDLTNTFWAVSNAGGRRVTEPTTMVFTDLQNVTLSTACGADRASVTMDPDGSAIGFDKVQRGAIECPPGASASRERILDLLVAVNEWRVESDEAIVLLGGDEQPLLRLSGSVTEWR